MTTEDIWIEPWMMKIGFGIIFLFVTGMLIAKYNNWFGFGGF